MFLHSLKLKLKDFPCHRFNVQHTSKVYDELVQCRGSHNSQNTRLLRKLYMLIVTCDPEPQLDTRQTTVYLLLVLGKVNKYVHGDYMFLTNVPFIELCNSCLHEHYVGEGVSIIHDVEYNDGCASQFKCQNISCSCLAQRKSNANLQSTNHRK